VNYGMRKAKGIECILIKLVKDLSNGQTYILPSYFLMLNYRQQGVGVACPQYANIYLQLSLFQYIEGAQ